MIRLAEIVGKSVTAFEESKQRRLIVLKELRKQIVEKGNYVIWAAILRKNH